METMKSKVKDLGEVIKLGVRHIADEQDARSSPKMSVRKAVSMLKHAVRDAGIEWSGSS